MANNPNMNAVQTVQSLITLGTMIADKKGPADWDSFLKSSDYQNISGAIVQGAQQLDNATITAAVATINQKQQAILGSKTLADLPTAQLVQWADLGNLKLKLLASQGFKGDVGAFGTWLVEDALPVMLRIAPIVIPLLL